MKSEDRLIVIYTDSRPELAQLLRNRLVEAGIEAFLENESLQQASGDLPFGLATAPRVVVAEHDLAAARAIVAEFNRETDASQSSIDSTDNNNANDPAAARVIPAAPTTAEVMKTTVACPQCGAPRLAECPFCQTSGANFAAAELPVGIGPEDAGLLICPTCDEPFKPGYLRRCEWCGHDFGEGIEVPPAPEREPLNNRVILVVIGTGMAIVAILAWFSYILK